MEVRPVFTHVRDVKRKPAPHRFVNGLLDLRLSLAGSRPITPEHFIAMLNLDKGAPRVIARSPERREFLARFHGPFRRRKKIGNFYRQAGIRRF